MPKSKRVTYGMADASDITKDDVIASFPDNDLIFADLKQLVHNGIEANARAASLTITYADGCRLTWSYDFNAE